MTSGHLDLVLNRLRVLEISGDEPRDRVLVVLPMFGFVSIGNLGQSSLSHEHVGVDDDKEEGEAAQANLIVQFIEMTPLRVLGHFDDHLAPVSARSGSASRSMAHEHAAQRLRQPRGGGGRGGGSRGQAAAQTAANHELAQRTEHRHRVPLLSLEFLSYWALFFSEVKRLFQFELRLSPTLGLSALHHKRKTFNLNK